MHKKARTTPEIRREIQASDVPATELAKIYGVHRHTIRKWRNREAVEDASHRPPRLHATLTPAQEAIVVCLRETLLLPLDNLLAVTRQFLCPKLSRSALDRMFEVDTNVKTTFLEKQVKVQAGFMILRRSAAHEGFGNPATDESAGGCRNRS